MSKFCHILKAIQVLLEFEKMLGGVHAFDCCARRQLHEDVRLDVGLGIGHHKINRPHVPTHQQGQDENTPYCCPRYHGGKRGPVSVAKYLAMSTGTQTGLPLQDFSFRVAFVPKGPYHGNGLGILWDLGLVDHLPVLEFHVLTQFTCHGGDKLVLVRLLHQNVGI